MKEIIPKDHKIHRHCLNDKMTTVQGRVDEIREMEVTDVKKRKSGEAFEVLIKTPGRTLTVDMLQ